MVFFISTVSAGVFPIKIVCLIIYIFYIWYFVWIAYNWLNNLSLTSCRVRELTITYKSLLKILKSPIHSPPPPLGVPIGLSDFQSYFDNFSTIDSPTWEFSNPLFISEIATHVLKELFLHSLSLNYPCPT